ncbi:hypothetical protein ABZ883_42250 [Streptomyces sp. NPDC046977]|uniref:hypothetical protein n=1 Tax=Streptomyces sp. NPDC046977 TaxID=3154703 RepID=UPI0034085860
MESSQAYLDSVVVTIPEPTPGPAAASLAATFNNTAVSQDTNTAAADLDGHGSSMSAQALATAGVSPGSTITYGGVAFRWPTQAGTGTADNTVAAGQTIALSGSSDTLGFLVAGSLGTSPGSSIAGPGKIYYSDGTSQQFRLDGPEWRSQADNPAVTSAYTNAPGNTKQNTVAGVWYRGISLVYGKAPVSVQLPGAHAGEANGIPRLHVFAMAQGGKAPSPAETFNNVSVTQDTNTNYGDMDGAGSSLSAQALATGGAEPGSTITHAGVTLTWPSTAGVIDSTSGKTYGEVDNTLAAGQKVAVDGTRGTWLFLLVAGANGTASGAAAVTYSDGAVQQFTLTGPDWTKTGSTVAFTSAYSNKPGNQRNQQAAYVHLVGVALLSGKTPVSMTLPNITAQPVQNKPALHVYAMTHG